MSRKDGQCVIAGVTVSPENKVYAATVLDTLSKGGDGKKVHKDAEADKAKAAAAAKAANAALQRAEQCERIAFKMVGTVSLGGNLDEWKDALKDIAPASPAEKKRA